MDLVALGRSALIIPTPGQQEQEYLGALHQRTGRFMVHRQDRVDLMAALREPPTAPDPAFPSQVDPLVQALQDLASLIQR